MFFRGVVISNFGIETATSGKKRPPRSDRCKNSFKMQLELITLISYHSFPYLFAAVYLQY